MTLVLEQLAVLKGCHGLFSGEFLFLHMTIFNIIP